MHLDVSLAKLIQNGPGSLGINSGYLCHYLPVALAIRILSNSLGYLARTYLRWTVFVCVTIGSKILSLVINNSILFESGSHNISSVSVTSIIPISSVLSQFAVSNLPRFFLLLWVQLHLSCVYSRGVLMIIYIFLFLSRINITIIVSIWICCRRSLLITGLPIRLSNSILHLSSGLLFKLLSHLILFSEPDVPRFTRFIYIVSCHVCHWSLGLSSRFVGLLVHSIGSSLVVGGCHVEHGVIKVFEVVLSNIFLSSFSIGLISILTLLRIFGVDINELVLLQWQLLLIEIQHCFT